MRLKVFVLVLALLLLGCGAKGDKETLDNSTSPTEQLFRWSKSDQFHSKKLLFIHGRFTVEQEGSLGHNHSDIENLFVNKLDSINWVCKETYGFNLFERTEVWFYTYNTHQEIDDIVADLATQIINLGWDGNNVCIVGYSQGGVVTWEFDRQYPELLNGAITLGAPVDGTPLASPILVDDVEREVLSWVPEGWLWKAALWLTQGASNVVDSRSERKVNNPFLMIAGEITAPPPERFSLDALDTILCGIDSIFEGGVINSNTRQHAELGATIIDNAKWRDNTEFNRSSDGIVPIASAIYGATVAEVWSNYDHYDLLFGKDDMVLARREFEWIDCILGLSEQPEFIEDDHIPELPTVDIIISNPLKDVKYVYIQNGAVWVADNNWRSRQISESDSICSFPRFNREGDKLVWTTVDSGQEFVCYLDNLGNLQWLSGETPKFLASFSPNGEWLVYQSDDELVIYNFESEEESVIISSGIDLISPPYWISGINGKIYFATNVSGQTNLYWVGPRRRNSSLGDAELVTSDCKQPFWVAGGLGGIVTVANRRGNEEVIGHNISIVTNIFTSSINIDIEYNADRPGFSTDPYLQEIKLSLSEYFGFEAAAIELSGESAVVYLTNSDGIYLLDYGRFNSELSILFEDIFMLLIENGSELDINPAWE